MIIGEYITQQKKTRKIFKMWERAFQRDVDRWNGKLIIARFENYHGWVQDKRIPSFSRQIDLPGVSNVSICNSLKDMQTPTIEHYQFVDIIKETRNKVYLLYQRVG